MQPGQPPMAQPVAQPAMQKMAVTVPQGMQGGMPLQVQTPAGLMQVTVPAGCASGSTFEMMVPAAGIAATPAAEAPPQPQLEAPPMEAALMETPPPAARSDAPFAFDDDPLPGLEPLQLELDDRKQALPSFEEYSRGPKKPVPTSTSYQSKLPTINQGSSPYDRLPDKDDKTSFEKTVFGLTIAGIGVLIGIEIFINTPLFQQIKPVILRFLGGGSAE